MVKLKGNYNWDLALNFSQILDKNIAIGIYDSRPAILAGFDDDVKVEKIAKNNLQNALFSIYLNRELTEEEKQLESSLYYIQRSYSESINEGVRVNLESLIDEDSKNQSIFYSTFVINDNKYVVYHEPPQENKKLTR